MADEVLQSLRDLFSEFSDLSLSDFRDAFRDMVKDPNALVDRYLLEELKNFRGNRTMRAEIASALAEREDEAYIEDFASVIEKETEVGLCKESITALIRIGTQEAIQKLEFLAKSKPNATIASLLRQELDKLKHAEKEPAAYYLDHIAAGNKNARNCIHASKVLIKIGDPKVIDEITAKFDSYDDLGRTEGAKVIAQLGQAKHLAFALDLLDRYVTEYQSLNDFVDATDGFDRAPKEDRIQLMSDAARQIMNEDQAPFFDQFMSCLEANDQAQAEQLTGTIQDLGQAIGLNYYLKSLALLCDNKIAHATQFHEETGRASRVRQSRMRHLLSQLGYGVGKITSHQGADPDQRERAIEWITRLISDYDGDICKLSLYGAAFCVKPEDIKLLAATLETHQIEGMTRLINTLERKQDDFTDFFLDVSMKHEILDIQEMAMRALGHNDKVFAKLTEMLADSNPETKRMGIRIIGEIRAINFKAEILELLVGQSDIIRIEAIQTLGKLGDESVLGQINDVMYDAKSPVLVEVCLKAIAGIGGEQAINLLKEFTEKTRNRKSTVVAIRLLTASYRTWDNPLPADFQDLLMKHLKPWFEERDTAIRHDAYQIVGSVLSVDLKFYDQLKVLYKEASTRLRAQTNWDKDEMAMVDKQTRTLNRNYFFLKDLNEFQKNLQQATYGFDNDSSAQRTNTFDRVLKMLNGNDRFVLSPENLASLEQVVLTGLEMSKSWSEQNTLFQIAGFSESEAVAKELSGRVKTVPKQAKANLMDALSKLGLGLQEINDLTSIKTILVLEGSSFYRKRLVKFLQGQGYEIRDTDDLEIAETMVKDMAPDLILTEITFVEPCDGASFVENINSQYGDRIQIIFSTNTREVSVMQRVTKLKPKKIFFKPYPMENLEEAIKA